ncbi:hypothetical protein OG21DRAFT_1490839 [Imleria badia]|nr:hypothetical protein OG21DRAFT_1490839 [Imleria badia]
MAWRVTHYSTPHVKTNVESFVRGITDTKLSLVSLGFPFPQHNTLSPSDSITVSLLAGPSQTQVHKPIDGTDIPLRRVALIIDTEGFADFDELLADHGLTLPPIGVLDSLIGADTIPVMATLLACIAHGSDLSLEAFRMQMAWGHWGCWDEAYHWWPSDDACNHARPMAASHDGARPTDSPSHIPNQDNDDAVKQSHHMAPVPAASHIACRDRSAAVPSSYTTPVIHLMPSLVLTRLVDIVCRRLWIFGKWSGWPSCPTRFENET